MNVRCPSILLPNAFQLIDAGKGGIVWPIHHRLLLCNHVYVSNPIQISKALTKLDPASFVIICFSLGLALSTDFRLLAQFCLRQFLLFTGLAKLWKLRFGLGKRADGIVESIEKEKKRRATRYVYKKWKVGF
jgi:hypothetical protein